MRKSLENLTAERLRELLDYDPETGVFRWKTRAKGRRLSGVAGSMTRDGYISLCLDGTKYQAHRVAWLYMRGAFPPHEIDHENRNRADNRFKNLREASDEQQMWNMGAHRGKLHPLKGAYWNRGRWQSQIMHAGHYVYLGRFDTPEEAHAVYVAAAKKHFDEFACGG